ncbi:MAG: DUF3800 domain-containing protein [Anaerolineae bacterium]|nr:DUF3800 domain-containing protein [Anaerolineae bacterium]
MKQPTKGSTWFFVDESGDPTFYDKQGNLIVGGGGSSSLLLLGFVEIRRPNKVRSAVLDLQQQVLTDPLLQGIPSLAKTAKSFHAKDDSPEVRYQMYKLISTLDIRAQFVVARKNEKVFRNKFKHDENLFYDHLIETLFQDMLHRYTDNHICFSKRGPRQSKTPLVAAVQRSIERFETKWETTILTDHTIYSKTPQDDPCLSVVDYMNWTVYRAFTRQEMRFYRCVEDKVSLLIDLYDNANYPKNWYSRRNPFDIEKASPLSAG